MYRLEMTQERHETEIDRISGRVDSVEAMAIEARQVAMATNAMVELMPQKVIEAIDARDEDKKKEKKMDSREKLFLLMGIFGTAGGIAGAIASIKQAFGG